MRDPVKKQVDLRTVVSATAVNVVSLGRFKTCLDDPKKKERRAQNLCRPCFYIYGRQGGASSTQMKCGICDKLKWFSNTAVDMLCEDCAAACGICKHCAADLDEKYRSSLEHRGK